MSVSSSLNGSENGDVRKRANLTDYQKHLIVFLHDELHMDIDEIREHDKLRTEDGKRILKKTICYWVNRFRETGDLKVKHRSGRPRLLNENKEKRLIKFIENNCSKDYSVVKDKLKLKMSRRTVNNYALRNQIRAYRSVKDPVQEKPNQEKTSASVRKSGRVRVETEKAKILSRHRSLSRNRSSVRSRSLSRRAKSLTRDENVAMNHDRPLLVRKKRLTKN